jgi:hypothetical protein
MESEGRIACAQARLHPENLEIRLTLLLQDFWVFPIEFGKLDLRRMCTRVLLPMILTRTTIRLRISTQGLVGNHTCARGWP